MNDTTHEPEGWSAFREQAVRCARLDALDLTPKERLALLALTLCEESTEFLDASAWREGFDDRAAFDELGDCAWALAMLEAETDLRVRWPDSFPTPDHTTILLSGSLSHLAGEVAACAKRVVIGRAMPRERLQAALDAFAKMLGSLALEYEECGAFPGVMAASVAKNHRRYGPDGFSVAVDHARDAEGRG